jgi:hypothetical protein
MAANLTTLARCFKKRSPTMPELSNWLAYALISLGMVLTPGPNMIYLISRSICQGRTAGYVSLGGVALRCHLGKLITKIIEKTKT